MPDRSRVTSLGTRFSSKHTLLRWRGMLQTRFKVLRYLGFRGSNRALSTLLNFYGSFQKGQTGNIILEYADRTLEDYFHNEPPTTGENIRNLWETLFGFILLF
jgi:hypothetical protein